jgi:hypothetical protein
VDALYRTGAAGSLVSVASFAASIWAAARLVRLTTASSAGAATAALLLVLNPNLLYLQATPMTEPLLLALSMLATLWTCEWLRGDAPSDEPIPRKLSMTLFAAMWTRYEAWLIVAALLAATALIDWQRGLPSATLLRRGLALAAWPVLAVGIFLINSRITVGAWFVAGGFFVPDPFYEGHLWRSLVAVWWGTHELGGYGVASVAMLTAAAAAVQVLRRRAPGLALVPLALFAAAILPVYAFVEGHPFRIRYMVPTAAASALWCGIAVGLVSRAGRIPRFAPPAFGAALIALALLEAPPLGSGAALVQEAQWDLPRSRERQVVTACFAPRYRGEKILASMGSLAHYMQELSAAGLSIRDFVHEGNGVIWEFAMATGPAPHARWMLVEEQAEGGDVLAQRIRADPAFTAGLTRVCEAGGVALYERRQ